MLLTPAIQDGKHQFNDEDYSADPPSLSRPIKRLFSTLWLTEFEIEVSQEAVEGGEWRRRAARWRAAGDKGHRCSDLTKQAAPFHGAHNRAVGRIQIPPPWLRVMETCQQPVARRFCWNDIRPWGGGSFRILRAIFDLLHSKWTQVIHHTWLLFASFLCNSAVKRWWLSNSENFSFVFAKSKKWGKKV